MKRSGWETLNKSSSPRRRESSLFIWLGSRLRGNDKTILVQGTSKIQSSPKCKARKTKFQCRITFRLAGTKIWIFRDAREPDNEKARIAAGFFVAAQAWSMLLHYAVCDDV